MAIVKTAATILTSISNAAGASKNGTELNLSTAGGALICGLVTNGGTGPTIACSMQVFVGEATGKLRLFQTLTAPTTSSAATDLIVEVPPSAMFVNVTFIGNTGQAVTVECYAQVLTSY